MINWTINSDPCYIKNGKFMYGDLHDISGTMFLPRNALNVNHPHLSLINVGKYPPCNLCRAKNAKCPLFGRPVVYDASLLMAGHQECPQQENVCTNLSPGGFWGQDGYTEAPERVWVCLLPLAIAGNSYSSSKNSLGHVNVRGSRHWIMVLWKLDWNLLGRAMLYSFRFNYAESLFNCAW